MTRIEEIEERLEKATAGPWEAYKPSSHYYIRADGQYLTGHNGSFRKANALLIANAPSDLEYLLSENKRLKALTGGQKEPCPILCSCEWCKAKGRRGLIAFVDMIGDGRITNGSPPDEAIKEFYAMLTPEEIQYIQKRKEPK